MQRGLATTFSSQTETTRTLERVSAEEGTSIEPRCASCEDSFDEVIVRLPFSRPLIQTCPFRTKCFSIASRKALHKTILCRELILYWETFFTSIQTRHFFIRQVTTRSRYQPQAQPYQPFNWIPPLNKYLKDSFAHYPPSSTSTSTTTP